MWSESAKSVPRAADIMVSRVITLRPDTDIFVAIRVLLSRRISGAPVLDARGGLVGLLSEKDCLKLLALGGFHEDDFAGATVADYMTSDVSTIGLDTDIFTIAGLFLRHPYRRLPVVDDGLLVGQVSRRDVLKGIETLRETRGKKSYPDYNAPQ